MSFRNRSFVIELAVTSTILVLSVLVFAKQNQTVLVGKNDKVAFETPVRIGKQVLPAGDYRVQHMLEGNNHVVTFRKVFASSEGESGSAAATEVVRTVCKLKSLGTTAKYTELHYTLNSGSKTKTLQHLLVQGETVEHMF